MSEKKLTIVTGASRGIGRSIALKFAKEGHDVVLFGRDADALKKVEDELNAFDINTGVYLGDIADEGFVSSSVNNILDTFGKVDHLINNAGMAIMKKVVDSSLDEFKQQIDANLYGVYNFTKAVLPSMIERRSGSIINIVSLAGKNPLPSGALYSAAKHAVLGFTKSLMMEVREYNIRVAAICPGSVDTSFGSGRVKRMNADKILQPDDVADTVLAVINLPVRALVSEIDIRPTNPK